MITKTQQMHVAVCDHIDQIKKMFTDGVQVSVVVHFPDDPQGKCDVLIGDVPDSDIIALVQRFTP